MNTKNQPVPREPEEDHKRQVERQIALPLILICLLCSGFFVLLILTTTGKPQSVEQWAQISTMFLILPALFLGLVALLLIVVACALLAKAYKGLPQPLRLARLKIIGLLKSIQTITQKPNQTLIKSKGMLAGVKKLFRQS